MLHIKLFEAIKERKKEREDRSKKKSWKERPLRKKRRNTE